MSQQLPPGVTLTPRDRWLRVDFAQQHIVDGPGGCEESGQEVELPHTRPGSG